MLTNTWRALVGGDSSYYTQFSWTQSGLTTGQDYQFRIRASNTFGWSEYSDIVTIRADEVPAQITPVTTTVETVYVRIAWSRPSTDYGSPVFAYRVKIQNSIGSYLETKSCDGSDLDIVQSLKPSCLIRFTELRADPYNLIQAAVIKATVEAQNVNGWSPISLPNTVGA